MTADSIIVLSGGVDSVTLLYHCRERIVLAVSFDYGSNHNRREIECAAWHCERLGIRHIVIPLAFMGEYFKSSLLSGADAIPEGDYREDNMKSTVVPFRNGIMLAVAAGLAESYGLDTVMMANHGGDHSIYPDCRPEFVSAISSATSAGTYNHVRVEGPFTNMTKGEIVALGNRLGIDYTHTYSCYKGGERHCGRCGTCTERIEAFRLAGVPDPTVYDNRQ